MNIKNIAIVALRALVRNKMRSILTSIGIIIGISSVILMIGLGNSARVSIREKINKYGINSLRIDSRKKLLTKTDMMNLKESIHHIKYISPVIRRRGSAVRYRENNMISTVYGAREDMIRIKDREINDGRFFSEDEINSRSKVAVIGTTVIKELFKGRNPIGEKILIGNLQLKVIGVIREAGPGFSKIDFDNLIIMPYTTAMIRLYNQRGFTKMDISTHSGKMIEPAEDLIRKYLRQRHSIPDGWDDDFVILTNKEKMKMAKTISDALTLLLAGIASISLFVGGIGIMNIMIVSVTERTREIGIRMAIGAKKRDILFQFLIEAIFLSFGGGIIGISAGIGLYYLITYLIKWPFIFSLSSVLISVIFATVVGVFFGFYPARKAADLKPIDALKYE